MHCPTGGSDSYRGMKGSAEKVHTVLSYLLLSEAHTIPSNLCPASELLSLPLLRLLHAWLASQAWQAAQAPHPRAPCPQENHTRASMRGKKKKSCPVTDILTPATLSGVGLEDTPSSRQAGKGHGFLVGRVGGCVFLCLCLSLPQNPLSQSENAFAACLTSSLSLSLPHSGSPFRLPPPSLISRLSNQLSIEKEMAWRVMSSSSSIFFSSSFGMPHPHVYIYFYFAETVRNSQ